MKFSLIVPLVVGTTCAWPQTVLTLNEALDLAEKYNPRLRVSSASVQSATAAVTTARAYPNPTLTLGSLGRQRALMDTAVPGMLNGFTFNQPVELPTLRRTRVSVAEIGKQSTTLALAEARLAVFGTVRQAFFEVLRRKSEVDVAKDNLSLLEDLRRRIQAQVDAGEAARLELVRADAELAAARMQVKSAELRRSVAMSALYAAIGTPLGNVDPQANLRPTQILPPLTDLVEEVLAKHPSVLYAQSETRKAAATVDFERSQRLPQPTLWADVFQQPDAAQYRFSLTVGLPVWNRREGPIAEAAAAERQAIATAAQRRVELSAEVERAYNMYEVANQQVEIFQAGTLRQAEAAVSAAEAAFRFGERGIIEVLDAQRVLRAARMDFLNAQFDRQQALIELEQLRGMDPRGGKP